MTKRTTKPNIDIPHVAKLANLSLTTEEEKIFGGQLTKILDYIAKIEKANTANVEPTYNVSPNKNTMRKDKPGACLTPEEALQNAANTKNGQFVTKGVFEE